MHQRSRCLNIVVMVLLILVLIENSSFASENTEDDILLFLPAIIASSPKEVCNTNDLTNLPANSRGQVVCDIDLSGATISLAKDVKLKAAGGLIKNGSLKFSDGKIDGDLLNSELNIIGNPTLLDPVFIFHPERWKTLVQGQTDADTAFENNQELERLFFMIKDFGGTIFKMDIFDAYFESRMTPPDQYVFRPAKEAVNLPSDFNLIMTDNTHLRVFPAYPGSELYGGSILAVRDAENITVNGGNLHGDRDQRYYSPADNGLEGSHLFTIRSGRNVTLSGLKLFEGSKGSIDINSFGFSFNPDYNPTTGITIKNCLFENSRRMSIALTDGRDVLIKDNTFINNGQPSTYSDGGEVGYAINIEPARTRDEDTGELLEYQLVFDTLIIGNTESGSRGGFATLTIGQDLTVEDNDVGTRVVTSLVSGTKVVNNRFVSPPTGGSDFAIFVAGGHGETVFNNEVANNHITGYDSGIITSTRDAYIHDNTMISVEAGILIGKTIDSRFVNNTINSSSRGINSTNTFNDNIEVKGNHINASGGFHIYLANVNKGVDEASNTMTFINNTTVGDRAIVISNAKGIRLLENQLEGGVQVSNATNVAVSGNTIHPGQIHGIRLFEILSNVSILDNTIFEPTGADRYNCLQNDSLGGSSDVTILGNTCN
ncbi:MAG: right-handed parallel beta-helix repeat-containing protein [Desulfocapsaceae bacterium]|nr:right-handed parallel beta-helix repeat-containing protein [Desulfocapsaceae bacterium]